MGSSTYTSVADFEAECRALIEVVDASSESRGPQQLTATTQPFDIEGDGKSLGHLLYDCYVEDGSRTASYGTTERQEWSTVVELLYQVDAGPKRREQVNAATNLAHRIQSAFVQAAGCQNWMTDGPPARAWVQVRGQNSGFLRLTIRLTAHVMWTVG